MKYLFAASSRDQEVSSKLPLSVRRSQISTSNVQNLAAKTAMPDLSNLDSQNDDSFNLLTLSALAQILLPLSKWASLINVTKQFEKHMKERYPNSKIPVPELSILLQ